MTATRAAIVLGASGSVGEALMTEILSNSTFRPIVMISRRTQPQWLAAAKQAGISLIEVLVPEVTPETLEAATLSSLADLEVDAVGFSVLGVGAGTGQMTIDAHRAVDVRLNAAFATGLKQSGRVGHLILMSAAGANIEAAETGSGAAGMPRFNRVKGEAEQAVAAAGPRVVSILRPAMILGSRHTPWLLARVVPLFAAITPGKYRSISTQQLARAMVACAVATPAAAATYHYPEMMALLPDGY